MNNARGYVGVLRNRNFLALWLAQSLSLLALNSTMFVAIIFVTDVTKSSTQTAAVISAFSLPAVFLSAVAGLVVDRISKKDILVVSNGLRLVLQALMGVFAGLAVAPGSNTQFFLLLIYLDILISSAIGQFFAPAEGAMIPLVVGTAELLSANSLFTFTVIGTQVGALIVLVPLSVKALGTVNSILLLAALYGGATALTAILPRDPVPPRSDLGMRSIVRRAVKELAEGWQFSITHRTVFLGILHLGLVAFLIFSVSNILPKYALQVLGLPITDAVFLFSPAGAGIILASLLVVRYAQRFPRYALPVVGMVLMGFSFIGFGLVSRLGNGSVPLFELHPEWTVSATTLVGLCSAVAGVALALILIPAQTAVQEGAPDAIRGRVLTVQFTLYNALGLPPLLTISGFSDVYGIPVVTTVLGLLLLAAATVNYYFVRRWKRHEKRRAVVQPLPLGGFDATTIRNGGNGHTTDPAEEPESTPDPAKESESATDPEREKDSARH